MTDGDATGGRYEAFHAGGHIGDVGDVIHGYAACACGTTHSEKRVVDG